VKVGGTALFTTVHKTVRSAIYGACLSVADNTMRSSSGGLHQYGVEFGGETVVRRSGSGEHRMIYPPSALS
jgi:hypothetical protein